MTLVSAAKPDPPSDAAASRSGTDVVLTWTDPFDGGAPLTAVEFRRAEPNPEDWSRFPYGSSCTLHGQHATPAVYQVRVWNHVGPSSRVAVDNVT